MRTTLRIAAASSFLCAGPLLGCTAGDEPLGFRAIAPVCVEEAPADEDWTCGEVYTASCEQIANEDISLHVQLPEGECAGASLLGVEGPFAPGEHTIEIENDATGDVVCTATLEVTDEDPPEVETLEVGLWPPNHKYRDIRLEDCIAEIDECDPEWQAHIVAVSSDEPVNDTGDGNTEPDIVVVDSETVSLRSERRGGSNGRVYTIDFEVEDGSGNVTESTCLVTVVHDQSGDPAVDDGPAYTVQWPAP